MSYSIPFLLRSIVWLQQQREAEQRGRGGGSALRGEHLIHFDKYKILSTKHQILNTRAQALSEVNTCIIFDHRNPSLSHFIILCQPSSLSYQSLALLL